MSQDIQLVVDVAETSADVALMSANAATSSNSAGGAMDRFLVKQPVTDSEIIWALKVVMNHQSYNS